MRVLYQIYISRKEMADPADLADVLEEMEQEQERMEPPHLTDLLRGAKLE
ncbi:hypothetical protein [Paenibacillus taihuensis]|nr:hypothetical protein [Paenibacillus taihuensis]